MSDINISDIGEGDDLLAEGYNISLESSQPRFDHGDGIYNSSIEDTPQSLESDIEGINNEDINAEKKPSNTIESGNKTYNVTFEGNRTIGEKTYLDKGNVTLDKVGGGLGDKENITLYKEAGSSNSYFVIDGNTPVKVENGKQIKYRGIKYIVRM